MNKISRLLFNIFSISSSLLWAGLTNPPNESNLTYIHVLFEWEEVPNATGYELQISESVNFNTPLISTNTTDLYYIEKEVIQWESNYYWRVRANAGEWMGPHEFSTGETMSNIEFTMSNTNKYANGYTIFGTLNGKYSAIIDINGDEVWNSGNSDIVFYKSTPDGKFFGCNFLDDNNYENYLKSIEFSLSDGIVWEDPNTEFAHHEIIQLPWGNYLGIVSMDTLGPIPIGDWTPFYQIKYNADGFTPEFTWQGDKIVEWDKDSKEVVWSWSTFDHFSMVDYDSTLWNFTTLNNDFFEWTHVNALWFDDSDSSIYISSRHLSRITKINYISGDIIWNMGHKMPSDEVHFGHDLGFSWQHSIDIQDNGNIVFLDNGNKSEDYRNTEDRITRALEIQIIENEDIPIAGIVWEYDLPEELFGMASGNVEKLYNGNYLITTMGGEGTTLEITSDKEEILKINYNTPLIYRANRIRSLYPEYEDSTTLGFDSVFKFDRKFKLNSIYPNPFNPIVNIDYQISTYSFISGKIYDLNGRLIHILFSGFRNPGNYTINWDGSPYPSGVYIFQIDNNTSRQIKKIVLLK